MIELPWIVGLLGWVVILLLVLLVVGYVLYSLFHD